MILNRIRFMFLATIAGFFIADLAQAQVRRYDGCTLRTFVVPLHQGGGSPGTPSSACGALPILEDGWTEDPNCLGPNGDFFEWETYQFNFFGPINPLIVFVEKIKLPAVVSPISVPFVIVEDVLIIPCDPRCSLNPEGEDFPLNHRPPIFFIDDVTFPPIFVDPMNGPTEYLIAFILPAQDLLQFFGGPNLELDWMACADFDSNGAFYMQAPTLDTDGNGCPDSCIELRTPGLFVPHVGIDEKGAGVVDFLVNRRAHGLTKVDVFEPQTNGFIPQALAGMQPGESHNTRPWCFEIHSGP